MGFLMICAESGGASSRNCSAMITTRLKRKRTSACIVKLIAKLAQVPSGVRVTGRIRIDRLPQQAHQQIAPPLGAEAHLDQLHGQFPAQLDVLRAEQAVVRQAQRLGQEFGVGRGPGRVKLGQDRLVPAPDIVGLPRQPGPDAQRQRRMRIEQRQDVLEPRLEQHRAGDRAAVGDPQPSQAQRGQGHGLRVSRPLGELIGPLEALAAGPQITFDLAGADPGHERGAEPVGRMGNEFQPTNRRGLARLTRHRQNLFAARPYRRGLRPGLAGFLYIHIVNSHREGGSMPGDTGPAQERGASSIWTSPAVFGKDTLTCRLAR